MATVDKSEEVKRVFLWCSPRTTSTLFLKCMTSLPKTVGFNEPYNCTWLVENILDSGQGEAPHVAALKAGTRARMRHLLQMQIDKTKAWHTVDEYDKVFSRAFFRGMLEADYKGCKLLFVKDMACSIHEKYHFLPQNFRHTFLIRDPIKAFHSYKKVYDQNTFKGMEFDIREQSMFPTYCGYKEIYDLWKWVKEHVDPNPAVIDSDDLLENPATIMKKYFASIDMPYSDDVLTWDASDDVCQKWKGLPSYMNVFDRAVKSSGFDKLEKTSITRSDLSQDLIECVDYSMPFYEEMYAERFTL